MTRRHITILVAVTLASVCGVAVRGMGYPAFVPQVVTQALSWFIEPGVTIWWFTLGAAFQSFPSSGGGNAVVALSNVAVWSVLVMAAARIVQHLRGRGAARH